MAQLSSRLSLIFALAVAAGACSDSGGGDGFDTNVGGAHPGQTAGTGATAGTAMPGGTTAIPGGTTAIPGGIAGTTTPGGIAGTTTPGGIAGTTTPGGVAGTTPGGTAGGHPDGGVGPDAGGGLTGGGKDGGVDAGPPAMGTGMCCSDGNCLCHGPAPTKLTFAPGPFKTASIQLDTGVAFYPTDATAPFAGVAICPGFLNVGPEMTDWGPYMASYGIVIVITDTGAADLPEIRAGLLLGSIDALKKENTKSGSPLNGKMSGRYGTSGYSMGGGGTTMAATTDQTLKSSVALAPWEPVGTGKVPSLVFCGDVDVVAPCDYAEGSYADTPDTTPKMRIIISGADHLTAWFGPQDGGNGTSGAYALAFQKVFLEGDQRWKPLLLTKPDGHDMITNIK